MINLNARTKLASTGGFTPHLECVACLVRQAHEAVVAAIPDAQLRETALRKVLHLLTCLDWRLSPPALAQPIHRLIRRVARNSDPYAAIKEQLNHRAVRLDPVWHRRLLELFPPFEAAVRLSILGNLLDVGAKTQLGENDLIAAFERTLIAPLVGSVAGLEDAIRKARQILYLADNAGEIIFDRWLLAQLPLGKFTVAVRGAPVLNDATVADAEWAELGDFCEIISNGSDAPGTLLADCSPEFRNRFAASDLILSKGQGNYESLAGCNKHIFFLFTVKCAVVGDTLGCPSGSLVIHHQQPGGNKVKRAVTTGKTAAPAILSPLARKPRRVKAATVK